MSISFFGVRSSLPEPHNCIFGAPLAQRTRQPPSSPNGSAGPEVLFCFDQQGWSQTFSVSVQNRPVHSRPLWTVYAHNSLRSQQSTLTTVYAHNSLRSQQSTLTTAYAHNSLRSQQSTLTTVYAHNSLRSQQTTFITDHVHNRPVIKCNYFFL